MSRTNITTLIDDNWGGDHVQPPSNKVDPLANFEPSRYMPSQNKDPLQNSSQAMFVGNEMIRDSSLDLGLVVKLIFNNCSDLILNKVARTIQVNANTAHWNSIYFPVNDLNEISELTAGRYDTFTESYESAALQAFGKSIRIEHNAWRTPKGKAIFAQMLYNFAISTRVTKTKDIISTLLACKHVPRAPNIIRELFINKNMKTIMRQEILNWDCLKQSPRGMQVSS